MFYLLEMNIVGAVSQHECMGYGYVSQFEAVNAETNHSSYMYYEGFGSKIQLIQLIQLAIEAIGFASRGLLPFPLNACLCHKYASIAIIIMMYTCINK